VRVRKILDVSFGVLVVGLGFFGLVDAFFPRFRNNSSCNDSTPTNAVQQAALSDARSRAAVECATSRVHCKFDIDESSDADGSFRISPYVVETNFFEGCIYKDFRLNIFVYDRDGTFVRTEEAPYGLS